MLYFTLSCFAVRYLTFRTIQRRYTGHHRSYTFCSVPLCSVTVHNHVMPYFTLLYFVLPRLTFGFALFWLCPVRCFALSCPTFRIIQRRYTGRHRSHVLASSHPPSNEPASVARRGAAARLSGVNMKFRPAPLRVNCKRIVRRYSSSLLLYSLILLCFALLCFVLLYVMLYCLAFASPYLTIHDVLFCSVLFY